MDWSECDLVEVIPGKVSGAPLVKGTRVPADAIVGNYDAGSPVEEIAENYPSLSMEQVRALLLYANERRGWDAETIVDWSRCHLVERVPGRCSGAPTVVGTRVFPDIIAECHWAGESAEDIHENYPGVSLEKVRGLIGYVERQKAQV